MAVHKISKGLDLPIRGVPVQEIHDAPPVDHVGLIAADYIGMKPRMECQVGDEVRRGQALFEDRKAPGVVHTAPAAGKVVAIHRGARRALTSVVIELSAEERAGRGGEQVSFSSYTGGPVSGLSREQVVALLLESGLWVSLRGRPFSRVADPAAKPAAIFVTATDTRPLAPDVGVVVRGREQDFQRGLEVVAKLCDRVWLCKPPGLSVPSVGGVRVEEFAGRHPAGLVGTHIHVLDPVNRQKTVWHLHYQDLLAIGRLFGTGELDTARVVSLAGPPVAKPRLLRTRMGAALGPLVAGELPAGAEHRVISGDVLSGRAAWGPEVGFLGRYDMQVSALREEREREFIGWLKPGADRFSTVWAYLGGIIPGRRFDFTTSQHGEHRDMVPIGMYERVMPLDILPTFLLRALLTRDLERAERLGALELDPEDLGLCTFVCPGKQDYGVELRETLDTILKEG